jgi:hypothetical protein
MSQQKHDELNERCRALTKAGTPCRAAVTESGLCFFHANPSKAVEFGRIGGRKNRHATPDEVPQLPRLDSIVAVRDALAQIIVELHEKRLNPRAATGLAQLSNALMRAIEVADLDLRIKRLEEAAASILQTVGTDASKL